MANAPNTPALRVLPGLALSLLVAIAAWVVAARVPFGSAPVLAIVIGLGVGALLGPRPVLRPGLRASSSTLLRGAVIVLGAGLPLTTVLSQGAASLPVIVITLGGCLLVAATLGRRLGIVDPLRTLIGVGTGICGASAIAAVTPVMKTEEIDVGYAVATIFIFNVLAVLTFPPLGHALGMSQHAFGVFSGTAINDLSSVVAAGNVYGSTALATGVVVKLTRTLMIVPVTAYLAEREAPARVGEEVAVGGAGPPARHLRPRRRPHPALPARLPRPRRARLDRPRPRRPAADDQRAGDGDDHGRARRRRPLDRPRRPAPDGSAPDRPRRRALGDGVGAQPRGDGDRSRRLTRIRRPRPQTRRGRNPIESTAAWSPTAKSRTPT